MQKQKTKVYDFADLPCPPFDVMYDDWYKPAPGEPYRPLIALPEKVRDLDPWWIACTEAYYFTGLDPPRTLQRGAAMATPMSPAANQDPTITPSPVQPVPSLPVKTDAGQIAKATDDPSKSENQVPPLQSAPLSNGDASNPPYMDGIPPTSTVKGIYLPQGPASKALVEPSAVNSEGNNIAHSPAKPQQNSGDSQQGIDPNAHDSGSTDSPAANSPTSSTADMHSGYGQQGADPNKNFPDKLSQLSDGLVSAPSSDPNPHAAQTNSNGESQLGSENIDPAPQPPTNDQRPLQSSESNVGISSVSLGGPKTQISSSEQSPVIKIPGALALTQAPNNPNAYLVAGSTLLPGSSAATISGTRYSLASSGALVVGTSTILLATADIVAGHIATSAALLAGNVAFTPLLGGLAVVGSSTLSLSGPAITSSGSILSLASGGLVVGSTTYAFASPASNPVTPAVTQEVPITTALDIGGQSFTANPSQFRINGMTVSAGGPGVTLNGTPVSLDRSGNLVLGTSTVPLESTSIRPAATPIATFEGSAVRSKAPYWKPAAVLVASILYWSL